MPSIKAIWFLLLLVLYPFMLDAETLYVRPAADCANNGDGSAYACAASAGAAGAFKSFTNVTYNASDETAGAVDPGDTLKMCGTFGTADRQHANYEILPTVSGEAAKRMTFDGDCTSDGGVSRATFEGGTSTLYGFNAGLRPYLTIQHLTIQGFTEKGFLGFANSSTDVTLDKFIILDDVVVQDIRGAAANGIDMRGRDFTIMNVICRRVGIDCIQHNGKRLIVQDSSFTAFSLDNANAGDGVQMGGEVDGSIVRRNYIEQATVDTKYCALSSGVTDAGQVIFEDNVCIRSPAFTVASGFYSEGPVIARRNQITGGRFGIHCAVQIGAQCDVYSNVLLNQHDVGIVLGSLTTTATVDGNLVSGAPQCIQTNTSSSTVVLQHNLLSVCPIGIKEVNAGATHTERYNRFQGIALPIDRGGAFAVGKGSLVEGTGALTAAGGPLSLAKTDGAGLLTGAAR